MRWSETGDSFIVVDTERFMRLLPQYFKTCNYASFVRQLNMYDFHKVKSMKNHQEFKHSYFMKNRFQDLSLIKRKKVIPVASPKARSILNHVEALEKLKQELNTTQQQFQMVMSQNQNLVESNKEVVNQLCKFRNICESRMRKIFYMMFVLIDNFDSELVTALEEPLKSLAIWVENWTSGINKEVVNKIFSKINELLSISVPQSIEIVDDLLDRFYTHYSSKNYKFTLAETEWEQLFENVKYAKVANPVFQDFLHSLANSPLRYDGRSKEIFLNSIKNSNHPSVAEDRLRSEKNSFFEQNLLDFDHMEFDNVNSSLLNSPSLPNFNLPHNSGKFGKLKWTDEGFSYRP